MTTPIRDGIANISRLPIMISMAGAASLFAAMNERMANSEWRMDDDGCSVSPFATPYSPFASYSLFAHLTLHQRPIIEPSVEPVLVARDILLHRDVDERLIQRNPRHVGKGEIDEAFDVGVVGRLVAGGGRGARAVDQLVHLRRLIAHGVEDGIVAVIAPVEEVFGVIEPAREHVSVERHFLLVQFGAPVGAGNLVDGGLDADLAEALLHQHAERFVDPGEVEVE